MRTIANAAATKSRPHLRVVLLAGLLSLLLVGSLVPLAMAATSGFSDVPASHPHYAAITDLASRGIVGGYEDGRFGPDDEVMRQQFAKMVVLTGGYPVSEDDVCPFTDVRESGLGSLYPDNYVAVCAAKGITVGRTASTFDPYAPVSRYQVITMVVRMADDLRPGLLAAPPAGWAATGVWGGDPTHGAKAARAEYNGLLVGLDLASLNPYAAMNRGEVARVLSNLLTRITVVTTTTETPVTSSTTTSTTSTTDCVP